MLALPGPVSPLNPADPASSHSKSEPHVSPEVERNLNIVTVVHSDDLISDSSHSRPEPQALPEVERDLNIVTVAQSGDLISDLSHSRSEPQAFLEVERNLNIVTVAHSGDPIYDLSHSRSEPQVSEVERDLNIVNVAHSGDVISDSSHSRSEPHVSPEVEGNLSIVTVAHSGDPTSGTGSGAESSLALRIRRDLKKHLTHEERIALYRFLLEQSKDGKLKHGSIQAAADKFLVHPKTVSRIWYQAKKSKHGPEGDIPDVSSKMKGRVGPKKKDLGLSRISQIHLGQRTSIRSLACALNVPKSTLYARIKGGLIRTHSDALKPSLTLENQKARLKFCTDMLNPVSIASERPFFQDMYNYVHFSEKWFFLTKGSERCYLLPEENEPQQGGPKVMFLAAVARPRFNASGNVLFDGKIGIFPFIYHEETKQSSKSHFGTMETHATILVTKQVTKDCLISKVLHAIRSKWPVCGGNQGPIYIQQDNTKSHISLGDSQTLEAAKQEGLDIRLTTQPPNSSDLNVLDLGFFQSIHTLKHQQPPSSMDELVAAVQKAFYDFSAIKLNQLFVSQQQCMIEIMKAGGGNNYRLPHLRDGKQECLLPTHLLVDGEIVKRITEN